MQPSFAVCPIGVPGQCARSTPDGLRAPFPPSHGNHIERSSARKTSKRFWTDDNYEFHGLISWVVLGETHAFPTHGARETSTRRAPGIRHRLRPHGAGTHKGPPTQPSFAVCPTWSAGTVHTAASLV